MAHNINDLYTDVLYKLRGAPIEETRNGVVKTVQSPVCYTMNSPLERVLFCPQRKANPYFHIMEAVWMFAGEDDISFLLPFNSRMAEFAEPDGKVHGAYGHRWRNHFSMDQIGSVITVLQENHETRQAVIAMWDPNELDMSPHWKDRPCNTHLYFRVVGGKLDMTVCNRSNDVVWGMCGANIVHMTYLQELIATAIKIPVGRYHVMSNNIHIYQHHWHYLGRPMSLDYYEQADVNPYPLLGGMESDWWEFLQECKIFVANGPDWAYSSKWLTEVVSPMYEHYTCRLNGDTMTYDTSETKATDWRLAEDHWREQHDN